MTKYSNIIISDYAADGMIITAVDAVDLTVYFVDASDGLISTAIDDGFSFDFSDINIPDNAKGGLIATDTNANNLTDCTDNASGEFLAAIDAGDLTDCADIKLLYNGAE